MSTTSESSDGLSELAHDADFDSVVSRLRTQLDRRRTLEARLEERRAHLAQLQARQRRVQDLNDNPPRPEDGAAPPPYSPADQIIQELRRQNETLHETNRQQAKQYLESYNKDLSKVLETHIGKGTKDCVGNMYLSWWRRYLGDDFEVLIICYHINFESPHLCFIRFCMKIWKTLGLIFQRS
jgi:hypothetical protein